MNKKRCLALGLLLALLLSLLPLSASAAADEPLDEVERAVTSGYEGEYVSVYTPFDEPCTLYVEGKLRTPATMLRLSLTAESGGILRVFLRPDEAGEFSVRINTAAGNTDFPTADKGTVVADETGGQSGSRCYDTIPGYRPVPAVADSFCRLYVCFAYTEEQADGVYDNSWFHADNPLSGESGFSSRELVLHMTDNDPKAVVYSRILDNNTTVRAQDGEPSPDSYAGEVYTDPFLKDIEGYIGSGDATRPLLPEQADYLAEAAARITAGAASDYEKALAVYTFAAENFYYDYLGWTSSGTSKEYCNPYENIRALYSGESGPNCVGGKVGTVCNGYAAIVIALCRAEGIPARLVCGYNGSNRYWTGISDDYMTRRTHWWAEVYADGRWVVVDANRGSQNAWRRGEGDWTVADDGSWIRSDWISYAGFDMNGESLAGNYCYNSVCSRQFPELKAPRITGVDTSSGYVTLRWEAVEGATGYYIYRGTMPESGSLRYYKSSRTTDFVSTGVPGEEGKELEEPGVRYYYRVRSVQNGQEGGWSNFVSAEVSEQERASALLASLSAQMEDYTRGEAALTALGLTEDGGIVFAVSTGNDRALLAAAKTPDGVFPLESVPDPAGGHLFTVYPDADTVLALIYRGDANRDARVNMRDSLAIKKHTAGTEKLEGLLLLAANADGDANGRVNMRDSLAIKKDSAGTEPIAW